jgi:hypothetical protein
VITFLERLKAIEDAGCLWTLGCCYEIGEYNAGVRFGEINFPAIGNSPEQAICKALKKVLLHFNPHATFH